MEPNSEGPVSGDMGSMEYPFIAMTSMSTLSGVVVTIRVPSMGEIDLSKVVFIQ